jgi:hypothetical protein
VVTQRKLTNMENDYRWREPRVDSFRWTLFAALGLVNGCGATTDETALSKARPEDSAEPEDNIRPEDSTPVQAAPPIGRAVVCDTAATTNNGVVQCLPDARRRTEAQQCEDLRTPAPVTSEAISDFVTCTQDSDCVGELSYCQQTFPGAPTTTSCLTGCLSDNDCAPSQLCLCGAPLGTCVPATCRADSDCEEGAACLSYRFPCSPGSIAGFSCTSDADSCHSFVDCIVPEGAAFVTCSASDGAFSCQGMGPCPVPGRPFLVAGLARLAKVTERSDYNAGSAAPDLSQLSGIESEVVGQHWLSAARMEHASIAAFARFQLQLLAVSAPARLVKATSKAMADELSHAQLCFALASAYLGRNVGPGPLDLRGAMPAHPSAPNGSRTLGELNLIELVRTVVREGCIGETLAALEAEATLAHAMDPAVRSALTIIARDEQEHALLAWRFIAWLANHDAALLDVVEAELERYQHEPGLRDAGVNTTHTKHQATLAAHGVPTEIARVRSVAWSQLIQPTAAVLRARYHARSVVTAEPELTECSAQSPPGSPGA